MSRKDRRDPIHPALPRLEESKKCVLDPKVPNSAFRSSGKGKSFLGKPKGRESKSDL